MNSPRPVAISCRLMYCDRKSLQIFREEKNTSVQGPDPDLIWFVNTDPGLNKRKKCRQLMYFSAGFLFGELDASLVFWKDLHWGRGILIIFLSKCTILHFGHQKHPDLMNMDAQHQKRYKQNSVLYSEHVWYLKISLSLRNSVL